MIKILLTLCLLASFSLSAHPEQGDDEQDSCPRFTVDEERDNEETRDCCDDDKNECEKDVDDKDE